mgnify:CR=1 FL=1
MFVGLTPLKDSDKKAKKYDLCADTNAIPETACEKPFALSFFVFENGYPAQFIIAARTSDQQAEWIEALQNALAVLSI